MATITTTDLTAAQLANEESRLGLSHEHESFFVEDIDAALQFAAGTFKRKPMWFKVLEELGSGVMASMVSRGLLFNPSEKGQTQLAQLVFLISNDLKGRVSKPIEPKKLLDISYNLVLMCQAAGLVRMWKPKATGSGWFVSIAPTYRDKFDELILSQVKNQLMPMLVEPVDHTPREAGGYLSPQLRMTTKGILPTQKVCDALNILQKTKWKLNHRVMGVLWAMKDVDLLPEFTVEQELTWKIANTFLMEHDHFYHAWFYQSRFYSRTPYLSPLGADLSRGLLMFADREDEQLTDDGVEMLKIHVANCYDMDKASDQERIDWVDDNVDLLLDIANDPMGHLEYWWDGMGKGAMSCQKLAAAFAIEQWLEDGTCHIALQFDGTCNGQQHCSAMLRDRELAELVNVVGKDRGDLYTAVGDQVKESWAAGVSKKEQYLPFYQEHGDILASRKLAKGPVMTRGYGGTMTGIADGFMQLDSDYSWADEHVFISEELNAKGHPKKYPKRGPESPIAELLDTVAVEHQSRICTGIAQDYIEALGVKAKSAEQVTKLIHGCCKAASDNGEDYIWWYTALGTKIMNKKYKQEEVQLEGSTHWKDIIGYRPRLRLLIKTDELDKRKQRTTSSPAFVHSNDGAHMGLTIIEMGEVPLHMIHDSFGCHANDAKHLVRVVREKFVEVHQQEPLAHLCRRYGVEFETYGEFDLSEVLESAYLVA